MVNSNNVNQMADWLGELTETMVDTQELKNATVKQMSALWKLGQAHTYGKVSQQTLRLFLESVLKSCRTYSKYSNKTDFYLRQKDKNINIQ